MNTTRPELSTVFDSDLLSFVEPETFSEIIIEQMNFFTEDEYWDVKEALMAWDTKSVTEIASGLENFLRTNRAKELKFATNLVLDHCMVAGSVDLVRVYSVLNTAETLIAYREMLASRIGQQEQPESED